MKNNGRIYLDHNATTPVDPRVLQEMLPYFTEIFGNAASIDHGFGHDAKHAVDKSREQIAKGINASPEEIIFTSGATESNNIALFGVAERYKEKGKHIITCVTEHKAVLDCCRILESRGYRITYLPVDQYGLIDVETLTQAITDETILISVMAANNEIGTIAPLKRIGEVARKFGVIFHSDAAQALGNIIVDVQDMNIDILSMSAHKIYGPKGIGALYRRKSNPRVNLNPVIYGGGHEKGLRSGTLNVPGIVGMGKAVEISIREMAKNVNNYRLLTDFIFKELTSKISGLQLNGHRTNRLAHNINISIPNIESKALIVRLKDIAVSSGSACTTTTTEPSHVIQALGYGDERAHTAIRIGVGRFTTKKDAEIASDKIANAVRSLQNMSSITQKYTPN